MDSPVPQPPGCGKVSTARPGCQVHDQAPGPQGCQHGFRQNRGRDGVHHRVKGRSSLFQPGQIHRPQAETLRQCPLGRPPRGHRHLCAQCRQPYPKRLPHRPKTGQQDGAVPKRPRPLRHQDADAALCCRDGVAEDQFLPGKVVHQLHARLRRDLPCLRRELSAQRQRPRFCGPQQLRQRSAALVQRQRQ